MIEKNRENLISVEGRKEYQKRMHTVEPVFGNIKFNLAFRQFFYMKHHSRKRHSAPLASPSL